MPAAQTSPKIISVKWGKIHVENLGTRKDIKLWPGGGRDWDWRETGTQHSPGIQIADVQELIDHGCQVIVLTSGRFLRLKAQRETLDFLKDRGIEVIIAETKKAVKIYNQHVEKQSLVGGLFHSTC